MKRSFLKVMATAAALGALNTSFAQDIKERTLKVSTLNPKGHPIAMGIEKMGELIAAKSGGKIKVNIFPGGTLGSDQAVTALLQAGSVEMHVQNSGILASQVKEFAIFDFPFMFENPKEVDAIVDGPFGKKLHARLADKGIVGLAYWELGFRNITNGRRPITKADDIAGLKLRVIPNPINVDWVTALGANPTPLPFPEVYAALEQKAIDGQENPLTVIHANKLHEVQKHLVLTNHQYNPQSVIFSKKVWDSLSAAERKIIEEAATEAARYQRQLSREQAGAALEALKKAGMQVTELPPEEIAKIRNKVKPVVTKFGREIGETMNELLAELVKLRAK